MQQSRYNLFTAIALIVGVVIGSGIFFRSDNILVATGGNVFLGILVFVIAAISIVFGCLTIAELAARTDRPGGVQDEVAGALHEVGLHAVDAVVQAAASLGELTPVLHQEAGRTGELVGLLGQDADRQFLV